MWLRIPPPVPHPFPNDPACSPLTPGHEVGCSPLRMAPVSQAAGSLFEAQQAPQEAESIKPKAGFTQLG